MIHFTQEIGRRWKQGAQWGRRHFLAQFPSGYWKKWSALSKQQGVSGIHLIFSFDCDTPEDAKYVGHIHQELKKLGVVPAYAVPCEILQKHPAVYEKLAAEGAEFLNHGYREHTFWNSNRNRYESCFFYDQEDRFLVEEDIKKGHAFLTHFLGSAPVGFRTPHFGSFCSQENLQWLHSTLQSLGYRYSSSTTPPFAGTCGSRYRVGSLWEFPTSGSLTTPESVQDTWAYFESPDRVHCAEDYAEDAHDLAHYFKRHHFHGILNYYGDPSHVEGEPAFLKAVEAWLEVAKPSSYREWL